MAASASRARLERARPLDTSSASFLIGGQDRGQIGLWLGCMALQHRLDERRYRGQRDGPGAEKLYRDFVGPTENGGIGAAPPPRLDGQAQAWIAVPVRLGELQIP